MGSAPSWLSDRNWKHLLLLPRSIFFLVGVQKENGRKEKHALSQANTAPRPLLRHNPACFVPPGAGLINAPTHPSVLAELLCFLIT